MKKEIPSITENEWYIMELLWNSGEPCTSTQIIEGLKGQKDVTPQTIRVMLNRLVKKEALSYSVDSRHAGIYHYFPMFSREECLREKNRQYKKAFFQNSGSLLFASLVQDVELTEGELDSLLSMLQEKRDGKDGGPKG